MPHDDKDFQIEPNQTPYPRRQRVNRTYKKISNDAQRIKKERDDISEGGEDGRERIG